MPKVFVYNARGEKGTEIELSDGVFGVAPKQSVVHQVFVALMANRRQPLADTKDRGEVRGGGKKPWKQKGTGRARHGSTRSPIWTGGGVTFGPLSIRNFTQKINTKMNRLAMRMCLSDKVSDGRLLVIETENSGKTKELSALKQTLSKGKSTVLLTEALDVQTIRAAGNIPQLDVVRAQDVNVVDLLNHQYVFASKGAISALEKRLIK